MARIFARRGVAEQAASYVLEAAPLAGDGVSRSIARIVASAPSAPDYLTEIEEMIAAWEMHRSGELEAFAHRLAEMGKGLTVRTFSETRLAFLQDTLESVDNPEERIAQRLRIATVLMDLARWKESEEQQRQALAEATTLPNGEACRIGVERTGATSASHQPTRRGRAADAAGVGDRRGCLRQATPDRGDSPEQLGDSAAGHQPHRGSRAADTARAGDRRGRIRRAAPDRGR